MPISKLPPFAADEPFDTVIAPFAYEGRAAQAVRRLKYSRETALADWMSAQLVAAAGESADRADYIIPVPIHWSRTALRGFNQSEMLCERFPTDKVRFDVLRRTRATRTQVGLSIQDRLENLAGAFECTPVEGKSILLIDDVLTSGQTARACAESLKAAGALQVEVVVFAAAVS